MILSAAPVLLTYPYDGYLALQGSGVTYTNENFGISSGTILSTIIDTAINNDELLFLTGLTYLQNNVTPISSLVLPETYITISSVRCPIVDTTTQQYLYWSINNTSLALSATPYLFNFTFDTVNQYVQIYTNTGLYLTTTDGNLNLSFTTLGALSATQQTFHYLLSGGNMLITSLIPVSGTYYGLTQTPGSYTLSWSQVTISNSPAQTNFIFFLPRFDFFNGYSLGQSNSVKYINTDNSLYINTIKTDQNRNYLITIPFKNSNNSNSYNFNVATLKNYYTPNYAQDVDFSTTLRFYHKIFTGLNQENGYDKIYLTYNGKTINSNLIKDTDNYFHVPLGATTTALSSSNFVRLGALGGPYPWRSDRIFKKQANYNSYSNWGNFSGVRNGSFFCSWLSAADTLSTPVWVDRYYNPNYVNLTSPVSSLGLYYSNNNNPNIIWDVPSTQTLEAGVLYYYHHIGDNDNLNMVNTLSGNLLYQFNQWAPTLVNQVNSLSTGLISNYSDNNVLTPNNARSPSYDTTSSYGKVFTTISDFNYPGVALSFFAYQANWQNIVGDQIVGNYYNGGIGIFNNNPILTPLITVQTSATLVTYNSQLQQVNSETNFSTNARNFILKSTYDKSYYLIDSNYYLSTFDADDLITSKVSLSSFSPDIINGTIYATYLTQENGKDYISLLLRYPDGLGHFAKYTAAGTLIPGTSAIFTTNNFIFDNFNNQILFNSLSGNGVVDSNNNSFVLSGNLVVRNLTNAVLSATSAEYIGVDQSDNIWVLYNSKNLAKINNNGNVLWTKQISTEVVLNPFGRRTINFIADLTANGIVYSALVVDGFTQKLYKVDTNGNILASVVVPGLIPGGDSTGFGYQKKYIQPNTITPGITLKAVSYDTTASVVYPDYFTLTQSTSALGPGWHHFAVVFDESNTLSLYIDGNKVNSASHSTNTGHLLYRIYNFKNNPNLFIGTNSFKTEHLNSWINLPVTYLFNGKVADVRFYSSKLSNFDVNALYNYYFKNSFSNINWIMPTGERSYIEEVERLFLHRLPGNKSQYFNIRIKNLTITDFNVRSIIENNINAVISKITPAYTKLKNIIWE